MEDATVTHENKLVIWLSPDDLRQIATDMETRFARCRLGDRVPEYILSNKDEQQVVIRYRQG